MTNSLRCGHNPLRYRPGQVFDENVGDCRLCYNFVMGGGEHPLPPLVQRTKNYAKAWANSIGKGYTTPEQKVARTKVCESCELFRPSDRKCAHSSCGCPVDTKASWTGQDCPLKKWPRDISVRHLLMHVYPRTGNMAWQWNVDKILRSIDLFNGARVVGVVTDDSTDKVEDVERALAGHNFDVIHVRNDPARREGVTHQPLWEHVQTNDPTHATFYCHAKGVTKSHLYAQTENRWTSMLYEVNTHWPAVSKALAHHPVAGAFRSNGDVFSSWRWYYSGSFYWFRNSDMFAKDWRRIDPTWYCIEHYLSLHFSKEEAAELVFAHDGPMYDPDFLDSVIAAKMEEWRRAQRAV